MRLPVVGGCDELVAAYTKHGLAFDDFTSSRFGRLRRIRGLSAGLLDEMLHRPTRALFPPPAAVTAPGRG